MFQDALRSARGAQMFVALVAAIISLFALSVIPVEDLYTLARTQVATAVSIEWSGYEHWLEERLQPVRRERHRTLADRRATQTFGGRLGERPIEDAWELLEPFIEPYLIYGPIENRDMLATIRGELNVSVNTAARWNTTPSEFGTPVAVTPLDILRFVKSSAAREEAIFYSVSVENAEREVWRLIANLALVRHRGSPPRVVASSVEYSASAKLGNTSWEASSSKKVDPPIAVLHCRIDSEWINESRFQRDRAAPYEVEFEPYRSEVSGTSIADWLREQYPALGKTNAEGHFVPFAGLDHVWREIADRPLSDADLYLSALAAEERRRGESVTVLEVTIPAAFLPIAGPLAILAILIHLSRLLAHVQRRSHLHMDEIREFAWPVMHAKRGWWIDPLVTLVTLPLVAQILITLKLRDAESLWVYLGWLVTGIAIVVAIRAWRRIADLRRRLNKQQSMEKNDDTKAEASTRCH